MKNTIQIPVSTLRLALVGLGKIINKHARLPVLNHVHVKAERNTITLTATNLDDSATHRVQQESQLDPIEALIPYDALNKVVKGCSREDIVSIEFADKEAFVSYTFAERTITQTLDTLPVEEFPAIPTDNDASQVPVNEDFKRALLKAFECVSEDDSRPVLQHAFIDVEKPKAHYIVGCDGKQLFAANSFKLGFKESFLIPSRKFISWAPFVDDGDWNLSVFKLTENSYVSIRSESWSITTKQCAGNYPNWKQVRPHDSEVMTRIQLAPESVQLVSAALKRLPSNDDLQTVMLVAEPNTPLILRASNAENSPSVPINGAAVVGYSMQITVQRKYLKRALDFELHDWKLHTPFQPIICTNGKSQLVIMPIRPDEPSPAPTPPNNPQPTAVQEQSSSPEIAESTENEEPPQDNMKTINRLEQTQTEPAAEESSTESAIDQVKANVELLKEDMKRVLTSLNDTLKLLAQAQREKRATEKEIEDVRDAVHSLQKIRI